MSAWRALGAIVMFSVVVVMVTVVIVVEVVVVWVVLVWVVLVWVVVVVAVVVVLVLVVVVVMVVVVFMQSDSRPVSKASTARARPPNTLPLMLLLLQFCFTSVFSVSHLRPMSPSFDISLLVNSEAWKIAVVRYGKAFLHCWWVLPNLRLGPSQPPTAPRFFD